MDLGLAYKTYCDAIRDNVYIQYDIYSSLISLVAGLGDQGSSQGPPRATTPPSDAQAARRIFTEMREKNIPYPESVYSAMIRCYSMNNAESEALDLLQEKYERPFLPKLRTFSPLLAGHASAGDLATCLWIYEEMTVRFEITPLERDYVSLLRVIAKARDHRVFHRILNAFMEDHLVPHRSTWAELGACCSDFEAASPVGTYQVQVSNVSETGLIEANGHYLKSVDLSEDAREVLLQQIDNMASQRESKKWNDFKSWVSEIYDVVIDGANCGYYKQNYPGAPSHVDFQQINWMVEHLKKCGFKPLVMLHCRHFSNRIPRECLNIVASWEAQNVLFRTPTRCNDDWFWLYLAVKLECYVITNDEMRDHHFQMLSSRSFARWKERHQIHFSFGKWTKHCSNSSNPQSADCEDADTKFANTTDPNACYNSIDGSMTNGVHQRSVSLDIPRCYSKRMQCLVHNSSYAFPCIESDEWLCCYRSVSCDFHARGKRKRDEESTPPI
eukprot:GSChrysophyteH1.ASY1.ANO1.2558.1 assembled CDS